MCEPASFIVFKDRAVWSKYTDSHEDIIDELGLYDGSLLGPSFVRVELSPHPDDQDFVFGDIGNWEFKTDQEDVPEWYDASVAEQLCRAELPKWKASKVFTEGINRVRMGTVYASCIADVRASGTAHVVARGTATVHLDARATAAAIGNVAIRTDGQSMARVSGSVKAQASGRSEIIVALWCSAAGCPELILNESSTGRILGPCHVELYGFSRAVVSNSAVRVSAKLCGNTCYVEHRQEWGKATEIMQGSNERIVELSF